jgi:DNA-binding CsgD family transcriptional regulator
MFMHAQPHALVRAVAETHESVLARVFALAFDEIDYGILLVDGQARVLHINHAAREELDASHPLQLRSRTLHALCEHDTQPLRDALADATQRGLRRLLALGDGGQRVRVTVVPLPAPLPGQPAATMLMLGRRQMCEQLSVQAYARSQGLTPAETRVLEALCADVPPNRIAEQQGVAVSTVRTQIGSIRVKTGAVSIRELVGRVARLPPMVQALRGRGQTGANDAGLRGWA